MEHKISRRSFIGSAAALSTTIIGGRSTFAKWFDEPSRIVSAASNPDLAVVRGSNLIEMTRQTIDLLGGMETFVPKQSTVGLLINSPWKNPGTYTNPDVALAVLQMCLDAGAKKVYSIENAPSVYWTRSALADDFSDALATLESSGGKDVRIEIPEGIKLKTAEIDKYFLECDVLIDIPVTKDHRGTRFTGTLKNYMGACPYSTNRFFHYGSGASGGYDDIGHLSRCIVDLNLVRKPDLCVVDATLGVKTNGPGGPGEIIRPGKIVAGRDRVAVDAYCATLLGLKPADIVMIQTAHDAGLGEIDLDRVKVEEATT